MNGEDRWRVALAHRLHAIYRNKVAAFNAGSRGNL